MKAPRTSEGGRLLTVDQVARSLQCHPHTVRRWIWSKKLRAVKVGDLVRVPEREMCQLLKPVQARRGGNVASGRGGRSLLKAMRRLRRKVTPATLAVLEAKLAEGEQAADWKNTLG